MNPTHAGQLYVCLSVKGESTRSEMSITQQDHETVTEICRQRTGTKPLVSLSVFAIFQMSYFYLSSFCYFIAKSPALLPGWMLSLIMLTCSSRSGRVCSCQNPITCPSSCTTMPNLSQFFPIDMAWGPPPRRPTYEQQLWIQTQSGSVNKAKIQLLD